MSITDLMGSNVKLGHHIARQSEHFSFSFELWES